jgi:uncharacterized protein (DUF305 family)
MRIRRHTLLFASLLLGAAAFPAAAQQDQHQHSDQPPQQQQQTQHGGSGGMMGMHGPAMERAMQHMQQGMGGGMSGNPDVDFARMMIPHHEGAIEMARSQLEHGKDLQLRQMAQEIIQAQEREIAILKEWLAQHQK